MKKIIIIVSVAIALGVVFQRFLFSAQGRSKPRIICFGDSITEGLRFVKEASFPYQLGLLLGEEVINTGISGETSTHALGRLEADVLDKNPELVIIQFGGNDPYRKIPLSVTITNNDRMIQEIQKRGITAVLLLGEYNMLEPDYLKAFRDLAKKRDVLLIEDAVDEIIRDPSLRVDEVHPNTEGHTIIAKRVFELIKPLLKDNPT